MTLPPPPLTLPFPHSQQHSVGTPPLSGDPQQDMSTLLQATISALASRGLRGATSSASGKATASEAPADTTPRPRPSPAPAPAQTRPTASAMLNAQPQSSVEPPALVDEAVLAFFDAPADQLEWLERCGGGDLSCSKTFTAERSPWRFAGGEAAVMPVAQVIIDQRGKLCGVNDAALHLARVQRRSVQEVSFGAYWVPTDATKEALRCAPRPARRRPWLL